MKFSDLLKEAIQSSGVELTAEQTDAIRKPILDFLQAWVAIHEPDSSADQIDDPQRALVLMLMEELEDRVEIPIV